MPHLGTTTSPPLKTPEFSAPADAPSSETIQAALADIVAHFEPTLNGAGKMKFYEALARKLSAAVNQVPPWSGKYVQSAISGTMVRGPLRRAIMVLAASLDDLPVAIARAERVEVYAEPGTVKPGAYVFGQSVACAFPGCPAVFVKDHWNRRFCPGHDTPEKRKVKK